MIILLAALLESASPDTPVYQRIPVDTDLNHCLGIDDKANPDDPVKHIVACYDAAQARAETELSAGYAKLRDVYKAQPNMLAAVIRGEEAFRAYRETWCKVDETAEDEPRMTEATAKMCRLELTRYQIYRIDSVG